MTPFSTYLGPVSRLIWFTLYQPFSQTWGYPTFTYLFVWRSWGHYHAKIFGVSLRLIRCSLVISLETLFSVSTNCSRASFYVSVYPNYPLFWALLPVVHLINTKSNQNIINRSTTLGDKQVEIMVTVVLGILWWTIIVHTIGLCVIVYYKV